MQCKGCRYWQGCRHSKKGDCYRVIAEKEPLVMDMFLEDEWGERIYFSLPFDPNQAPLWKKACPSFGVPYESLTRFYTMESSDVCFLWEA